jgi:O-glycosyl hydrolase
VSLRTILAALIAFTTITRAAPPPPAPIRITIQPSRLRQEFQGLGCGAIFYEAHITSLAATHKDDRQRQLYDDMFAKVPTRYLQLMIRSTHEPQNDNDDPFTPAFDPANFKDCEHTLAIARAAKERRPDIEFFATLYTPPPWMKTNDAESGGGKAHPATLKPKMELELAEYAWSFLAHTAHNGVIIKYLSVANEPDWPHDQPGCAFTAEAYASLFLAVGQYLEKMAVKYPDVPRAILVGPNTLSAPGAVKSYVPLMLSRAGKYAEVLATHDYDPRGDRFADLQRLAAAGRRPVWMTEWCSRAEDQSPGQINAATDYAREMHDVFVGGGANVFMSYDWAYPPRKGGEALIHIDWGNDYTLTKPYWVFRQWATPLVPGMHLVDATASGAGAATAVLPTAFLSADKRTLVIHIVNTSDADASIVFTIPGARAGPAARHRTSATEDMAELPDLPAAPTGYADALPARSLCTYLLTLN